MRYLLLLLLAFFLATSSFGQKSPIDTLSLLPSTSPIKEKVALAARIEQFCKKQKDESSINRYLEIAIAKNDSIFLGSAYYLKGEIETSQNIKRSYGIHLDHSLDEIPLYDELSIYHDKAGTATIEELRKNASLFGPNQTADDSYQYAPNEVYWAKFHLRPCENNEEYLLHLSSINKIQPLSEILNYSGNNCLRSWDQIECWTVSPNDSIWYYKTGNNISDEDKPIPSITNLIPIESDQRGKVTIYVRMQGADPNPIKSPDEIKFFLIKKNAHPGLFPGYPFKGEYHYPSSIERPFTSNVIMNQRLYVDESRTATIADIVSQDETLKWQRTEHVPHLTNTVYWMKAQFYGGPYFNGSQMLNVSSFPSDGPLAFQYIDAYYADGLGGFVHQQLGTSIPLSDRPYRHWFPFIKLDIAPQDTLDLFIRMADAHANYIVRDMGLHLYHVDPESVFPSQSNFAFYEGLCLGIFGIQCIFFLLLFLIEKELIHLYFSILVLGALLSFLFSPGAPNTYVVFPTIWSYHMPLLGIGVFCIIFGFFKFIENYFNYPKTSFTSKWIIPGFTIWSAFVSINFAFHFEQFDENLVYHGHQLYFQLFIGNLFLQLLITLILIIIAPKQKYASKLLVFLAFFPPVLVCMIFMYYAFFLPHDTTYLDFILKAAVVIMTTLLALSMGYRTNRLKDEKAEAIENSLLNQQATLESELLAENLQKLNQSKTQLYTNITHEFRTPLTVIMGLNQELLEQQLQQNVSESEKIKLEQGHQLIDRNSKNLLHLINQLLDLSKADSGMLTLDLVQGDIVAYLNYLTESFYSKAKEKDIRLVFYTELSELIMDYDESKIQQLVYNLLSNALKFTPNQGKVVLHLQKEMQDGQAQIKMKVSDNGQGIDSEYLPHIFDRFYQVDDSSTRNVEGTGIGLALTKELVELMEGTITVVSEIDNSRGNRGTIFTVTIPIQNIAPIWAFKEIQPKNIANSLVHTKTSNSPDTDPIFESDIPLILIVEDNPDVTIYIKQLLEKNYQIQTAVNGKEGIDKAFEIIPDIIVSDVMMPKKDGYELTKTLKSDTRTSHIPIILLTAKATEMDKLAGLKTGADAYLTKPFNKEELYQRLENLTQLRKAIQRQFSSGNLSTSEVAIPSHVGTLDENFVQKLKTLVISNLTNQDLNTEKMCKEVDLSQSQLYRKLKALTNETPNSFIRHTRLNKAMEL